METYQMAVLSTGEELAFPTLPVTGLRRADHDPQQQERPQPTQRDTSSEAKMARTLKGSVEQL